MDLFFAFLQKGGAAYGYLLQHPLFLLSCFLHLGIATITDLKYMKIPNKLNGIFLGINSILFVLYPLFMGDGERAVAALIGGLCAFLLLLVPAVITGFQMAGDIKCVGVFGLALGGYGLVPFFALALLLNIATNLTLISVKKKEKKAVIPFAPFFLMAFAICIGVPILN